MTGESASALVSDASYTQARLYFLDELAHRAGVYTVARALDLTGELDPSALDAAVRGCVRRHESLRTCFRFLDGRLRQIVTAHEPALRVVDLRSLLPRDALVDGEALVAELARQEAAEPFDLRRVPLLRTTLIRLADRRSVLLVTLHHIVADAWSLDLFLREVSALYQAHVTGAPHRLPELSLQYADFAAWQQRAEAAGGHDRLLAHWRDRLHDLSELTLPTDRLRPKAPSHQGRSHSVPLDGQVMDQLRILCREEGASVYMALLAAFYVVLHRYSGQDDLTVGGTTSGRARPEVQHMIGFFVNMLVLRTRVRAEHTLRDVLRAAAETCHDAYDHQELPFERLVADQGGAGQADRHPLFQVVFQMIDQPDGDLSVPGLRIRMREQAATVATFDLVCTVTNTAGRLSATLDYATDLWDRDTVATLGHAWQLTLRELAHRPDCAVRDVPLAQERTHALGALPDDVRRATALADLPSDAVLSLRDPYGHPAPRGAVGELVRRDRPDAPWVRTGLTVRVDADGRLRAACAPDDAPVIEPAPAEHATPAGPIERELAMWWEQLLGVTGIGRHDNFFVLGGHSLLATVLITRAQEHYGTDVTLDEFFRTPTLAGLAEAVAAAASAARADAGVDQLAAIVDALERAEDHA
ncbi:condensation domain-containing protein [Streptomyces sp. DT24]|uniref:condensation domain-containing protein n=1 Tax=Streptomyces sp. DT24 TaxID=3416520 RepID=UPI003CF0F2D8